MISNDNEKVLDLAKVSWCKFYWSKDDDTIHRKHKPKHLTWFGKLIDKLIWAYPYEQDFPQETLYERIIRLEQQDIWIPVCICQVSYGKTLRYTGDKALSIWKTWNAKIYGTN